MQIKEEVFQQIIDGTIENMENQKVSTIGANTSYLQVHTQISKVYNIFCKTGAGIYGKTLDERDKQEKAVKYNFYWKCWVFHDKTYN